MKLTGSRCRCPVCGEGFNSASVFDRHRRGGFAHGSATRRCMSGAEMTARGWSRNSAGFWIVETRGERASRAAASRLRATIGAEGYRDSVPDAKSAPAVEATA